MLASLAKLTQSEHPKGSSLLFRPPVIHATSPRDHLLDKQLLRGTGFGRLYGAVWRFAGMDKKVAFFDQLSALNDSSDGEEDTNELRGIFKSIKASQRVASSNPASLTSQALRNGRTPLPDTSNAARKVHRTTSAPVAIASAGASAVRDTPPISRKKSLLRHDSSAPVTPEASLMGRAPPTMPTGEASTGDILPSRTVSTPTIGSVFMTNSTGIADMLRKKPRKEPAKKRKSSSSSSVSLVPEHERIFQGKTFFYVPPDDKAAARRLRINKARSHGAVWTQEWISGITHIIVDKGLTYAQVMKFLRENFKIQVIPRDVVLVNENYPIDCWQFMVLLNPDQHQYKVEGALSIEREVVHVDPSQQTTQSLEIKEQRSKKRSDVIPPGTPDKGPIQSESKGVWLPPTNVTGRAGLCESPRGGSPGEDVCHSSFGVELDEMIGVATNLQHLPIDEDDEDEDRPPSSEGPEDSDSSGGDRERAMTRKKKRKTTKGNTFNQEAFVCMEGGTGIALESNPNRRTIEILQEMADFYDRMRDTWRSRAYRMAIGTLKKQNNKISTYDDAIALRTIGHRLAMKIEEIVLTNRLRRLDNAKLEPSDETIQLFLKIYGSGIVQASEWTRAGYKTLEDLLANATLTPNQRIGIDHYDDFNTSIPRAEVTALGDIVKAAAFAIDPSVEIIIGGSYRRGSSTSGDIDFILTRPGTSSTKDLLPFLHRLVTTLTDTGFLVAALAVPGSRHDSGSKWHGACVLPLVSPAIWRRIDFLLVPATEFGAALIYFTGDDLFNRSLRLLASRKGMRLNQRGLYRDVLRGPGRVKLTEGTLVEGVSEEMIFAALGVPWRVPEERILQ